MLHESELGNDQIQLFFSLGGYEYRLWSILTRETTFVRSRTAHL